MDFSNRRFKTEQHVDLIMAEKLQAGQVKLKKRAKYKLLDEQLQQMVSSFHLMIRNMYFKRVTKRARAQFIFSYQP